MSVLVKGMEMPENCLSCWVEMLTDSCPCNVGIASASEFKDKRHCDCPLVEVPTPHGRLVDADAEVTAMYYDEMTEEWKLRTVRIIQVLADCVDDSIPTIIEAEE